MLLTQRLIIGGTALAQWICVCLPSSHHGFESQAHHLFKFELCHVDETKINKKEAGIRLLKKTYSVCDCNAILIFYLVPSSGKL